MVKIGETNFMLNNEDLANYGHNDFHLALGYKAEVIKDYFLNY